MREALTVAWRFCRRVVQSFLEVSGLQHSATLAFFALLSIMPFTIITVGMLARLAAATHLGLEDTSASSVLDPMQHALPFLEGGLQQLLLELAQTRTSLNIVSGVMLMFAASAGFNAASNGINAMLRTERKRQYLVTKLLLAGLVILAAGAMFVWTVITSLLDAWAAHVDVPIPAWMAAIADVEWVLKLVVLANGFYFVVKVMATERYRRKYRWIGACVFVVFFELARWGFAVYLTEVVSYSKYYGTAGAFFGLSLWLYVAAIVMLGSCALIRTLAEFGKDPDATP